MALKQDELDEARFVAFGLLGHAIFELQHLEDLICQCWLNFSRAKNVDGKDMLEFDSPRELYKVKKTKPLGVLLADIKKTALFTSDFEKRFGRYLKIRNRLVHKIFNERRFSHMDNLESIAQLQRFVLKFSKQTAYFYDVFDAYLGLHLKLALQHNQLKSRTHSTSQLKRSLYRLFNKQEIIPKRRKLVKAMK